MEPEQQPSLEQRLDAIALSDATAAKPQTNGAGVLPPAPLATAKTVTPETVDEDEKWGLPLNELYRLGFGFFKDKSGKAVHLSYEDNLKLIAFTQQVSHGPLDTATAAPLGVFDVIGRNRRLAWQQLGALTRPQAQDGFIELLDRLCAPFRPYVEAIKQDRAEKRRQAAELERRASEQQEHERRRSEEQQRAEEVRTREELQRRQLQDALNQQTFEQFRAYADKQYPGNPDEQALLIRQLQTEHYHQYMQQLQAQVVIDSVAATAAASAATAAAGTAATTANGTEPIGGGGHLQLVPAGAGRVGCQNAECMEAGCTEGVCLEDGDVGGGEPNADGRYEFPNVGPASMWTRTDIKEFKVNVLAAKGDGVLQVNHGHMVTVRVPTRADGSCLFWEFATDAYDIGFGLYFEWGKSETQDVTVTVDEEDEEMEDDEDLADEAIVDLESGSGLHVSDDLMANAGRTPAPVATPLVSSIIPCYRRDSHKEVYAGSHMYPGDGVYLLKFDNCFSMWRSKTLYYKVFYTR